MPVQTIECLLTQAQLKRYLAGAELSNELLVAMERHLKACPDCMAEAQLQREQLGGAAPEQSSAVVEKPKTGITDKLKTLFVRNRPVEPLLAAPGVDRDADPWRAIRTPKNLALSGGLAIVLVAMSAMSKNPGSLLGPRAIAAVKPGEAVAQADPPKDVVHEGRSKDERSEATSAHEPDSTRATGAEEQEESTPSSESHRDKKSDGGRGDGHEEPEKAVDNHVEKPPATGHSQDHKTETPEKPVEPVQKPERVGSKLLVAESGKPVIPLHKPTKKVESGHKTVRRRPAAKRARKPVPQTNNTVRIYLPDGTIKH